MGANEVITVARAQLGKPYVFGAVGPNSFDCSGLVVWAFKKGANKTLPHFTGSLLTLGSPVSRAALLPGDLVFPDSGHVQIYTGNGMVIEAPHTGLNVREVKMWGFWKGRRLIAPGTGTISTQPVSTPAQNVSLLPDSVQAFADKLTDSNTWWKFGMNLAGAMLLIIGLTWLAIGSVPGIGATAKLAKKVVA